MEVKIGKHYRTAEDRKVLILAVNPYAEKGSDYEFVTAEKGANLTGSVGLNGRRLSDRKSSNDLIEEWNESEDAPLEFDDIEFGTAFKPKSREYDDIKCYPQTVGINEVSFSGGNYSYLFMKENWLMQIPGTTEWVPCSKKSIASSALDH